MNTETEIIIVASVLRTGSQTALRCVVADNIIPVDHAEQTALVNKLYNQHPNRQWFTGIVSAIWRVSTVHGIAVGSITIE